ncbi:hypothetical protein GCM10025762_58140 [Haloechinothrix salitolerans]
MGYTAQQIADMLQSGEGPNSYYESSTTSRELVNEYKERQSSFARLIGRLETAWVGESGDAARGAMRPLSEASKVSSENQHNVSMQMDTQGESFNRVKNTVGTGPGPKPESTFASDWVPIFTDRDEQIESWNAKAQAVVDAYNSYYEGTKQNAGVFPSSYGTLTGDPKKIDFNVGSSGGTGSGGGGTAGPSVGSPTTSGGGAWTAPSSGGTTAPGGYGSGSYGSTGTGTGGYASGGGTTSADLPSGAVRLPDGSVRMPDGSIHYPDGSIRYPDGRLRRPDGTIVMPDGTVIPPGGTSASGLSGSGSGGYGGELGSHGGGAVPGAAVAGGGFAGAGAGTGAGAAGGYGHGGPGSPGRATGAAPFGPGGSGAAQAAAGKAGAGFGPRGGMGGMMGGAGAGRGQGDEDKEHKDRYYIKQEMDAGLEVEHDEHGEKLVDDQTGNLVVRPVIGE